MKEFKERSFSKISDIAIDAMNPLFGLNLFRDNLALLRQKILEYPPKNS